MANRILVNPFPYGVDTAQKSMTFNGTIALAGAAVSTGEPLNWDTMLTGIGFNETNFVGVGNATSIGILQNNATALVTVFAASAGTVTATAGNNFVPGQNVSFIGNTSVLGLLLNGVIVTVVTASATQFTFLSSATGTGTGEVGLAYTTGQGIKPIASPGPTLNVSVTSLAVSGGIITATAANQFLPGARVTFADLDTALGLLLNGTAVVVASSTGTAFTFASTLTGSAGADAGTAQGFNLPQPSYVQVWSAKGSGYQYVYSEATGVLFAQVGAASASLPLANLAAGAYPAAILADVIKFRASWAKA